MEKKVRQQQIRDYFEEVLSEKNGENWWNTSLFKKNILPNFPQEVQILKEVPSEEENYNCFVYVLNLQSNSDFLGIKNWEFTGNLGTLFEEMISKNIFKKISHPEKGCMILYRTNENIISHVGIMYNKNTVISKWSWGPVLKHDIFDVPNSYGNSVEFYLFGISAAEYIVNKRLNVMTK